MNSVLGASDGDVAYTAHSDTLQSILLMVQGGTEKLSVASFRWAAATLLSRSFSLDIETGPSDFASDDSRMAEELADLMADTWAAGDGGASEQQSLDGPQIALVPWADMLNHSSAAGSQSCIPACCPLHEEACHAYALPVS